ncbi:MFS transporter [Streptomyces sp. BR123]|uniref:MFS transporter n=1 Tax=Streptomyces sp. BR123 TaxID=2749828 RepID=UPI0015C468F4|nr:MFS transporter [Streptomyces sp. BR123]NXY93058.1 MFS transporter [Streptomyces sp. BR123]
MSRLRVLAILVAVLLPSFMTALDNTVVNVALPQIQAQLALREADLKWVAAIYPLALASLLLLGGHLADTVGRRATLWLGVALFTVASVGCSAAPSGTALIACRGLQGAGAALILPASLAVLSHDLPPRARNAGFNAITAVLASALACGPVVSGVMTQHLGWQSVFAMNTPLGCTSILVGFLVPRPGPSSRAASTPSASTSATLSLRVVALACCLLAALAYCLIEGPEKGFGGIPLATSAGIIAASAVGLSYELTSRRNTVLRPLFRQRPFTGGIIIQLLWGLSVSGVFFLTSQFLQNGLGLAPTPAGLAFIPVAFFLIITTPFIARMARRWGDGRISAAGLLLVGLGLLMVALGSSGGSLAHILPGLSAIGFGSALAVPLTTRALESSPDHLSGIAAGLFSAVREASGVVGIGLVGAVMSFVKHAAAAAGAEDSDAFLSGYQAGLCLASALVGAGVPVALWALRHRRSTPEGGRGASAFTSKPGP